MLMDVLQWSRHYRCFPGQGGFDLPGFVQHVLAAGYRGPLSLEVFNDIFRQADAERTATDALRSLIALEESLSRRLDSTDAQHHEAGGASWDAKACEPVQLAAPPAPVEPSSFAFVEITVDPLAEMAAELLLGGAGFVQVASHRTGRDPMWQQGAAQVLLNRTRPSHEDWPRGAVAISAIAVESRDPSRSADRARQLLAPATARPLGPGEADLYATAAPDGTEVVFCRNAPGNASLRPVAEDSAGAITRIDHGLYPSPPTTGRGGVVLPVGAVCAAGWRRTRRSHGLVRCER
jgi:4-hydroxyphenylpyruvate dioxygenase